MAVFTISLNQFIEASKATPKAKLRIVQQLIEVNKFLTPWYQLAKNRIKIYLKDVSNIGVLKKAIQDLQNKPIKDDKAKNNIKVSIEAIHKVIGMHFENILVNGYKVIEPDQKNVQIEDVNINVNPDLVYKYLEDGIMKVGAIKFHVSKSKPFDLQQSKHISNILSIYLKEKVVNGGEIVDPKLCWAYDVFTDRLIHADQDASLTAIQAKKLSLELIEIYKQI